MSDDPEDPEDTETKAIAKAVEEAAKAVQVATQEVSAMATYLARLVGTVPEDFIDIVLGQPLRHLRTRTGIWWAERTYEYVKKRGIEQPKKVSPKGAIAVFEAATEETDETILDLWARLMANAMDPDRDTSLSKQLIEVLTGFEPDDAIVFKFLAATFSEIARSPNVASEISRRSEEEMNRLSWRDSRRQITYARLRRLSVIKSDTLELTYLGQELWFAVKDDGAD